MLVRDFRRNNFHGWHSEVFENREGEFREESYGYYREVHPGPPGSVGSVRIVLGRGGEVYISGNHYSDFRQVVGLPE